MTADFLVPVPSSSRLTIAPGTSASVLSTTLPAMLPVIRQRVAQLATECEVARLLGVKFVTAAMAGGKTPTIEASCYKLYATEL